MPDRKFVPPYRMGDVVRYVGEGRHWPQNMEMIIHNVTLNDRYEYSTDHGAWFDHTDFELVRECDAKSMKKLAKSVENGDV